MLLFKLLTRWFGFQCAAWVGAMTTDEGVSFIPYSTTITPTAFEAHTYLQSSKNFPDLRPFLHIMLPAILQKRHQPITLKHPLVFLMDGVLLLHDRLHHGPNV